MPDTPHRVVISDLFPADDAPNYDATGLLVRQLGENGGRTAFIANSSAHSERKALCASHNASASFAPESAPRTHWTPCTVTEKEPVEVPDPNDTSAVLRCVQVIVTVDPADTALL